MPTSIFVLVLVATFFTPSLQAVPFFLANMCIRESGNYTEGSTYQHNLQTVLSTLKSNSASSPFSSTSSGTGSDTVYGRYYCRHDLSLSKCTTCVHAATKQIISGCPKSKEAIVWYEKCTLLYLNGSSRLEALDHDWFPSLYLDDPVNVTDPVEFYPVLTATMNQIINESAYGAESNGFATAEARVRPFQKLYSLAQCSWDTTGLFCERCLRRALHEITLCCKDTRQMAYFYATCQLRYSIVAPFYDAPTSPAAQPGTGTPPPPAAVSIGSSATLAQPPKGNGSVARSSSNIFKIGFVIALTKLMLLCN